MMKKISVVMPTYNRAHKLEEVLNKLIHQSISHDQYEIIVVDNNSKDNTQEVLKRFSQKYSELISFFLQKKKGAAATRNLGAKNAQAEIILFLDDDMLADQHLLEEHIKAHQKHEGSVLGYFETKWAESDSLFLQYLQKSDTQNTFPFKNNDEVSFQYFYTGNVSVRKSRFKLLGGFDEGFKVYGVEDIALGYTLSMIGEKCYFCKSAFALHDYNPNYETFYKKRFQAGYSLGYFHEMFPQTKNIINFAKNEPLKLWYKNYLFRLLKNLYWKKKSQLSPLQYQYFHWTIRYRMYQGLRRYQRETKILLKQAENKEVLFFR